MLIESFVLFNHVDFMLNKNLGFESKSILFSQIEVKDSVPFQTVREKMLQHPEIADISFSSTIPFMGNIGGYISWEGGKPDEKVMLSRNYVNYDFIPTYDLKMKYGRNFSKDYPSDYKNCVINETALKMFGWSDPIGKQVILEGKSYPVIGVVNDFHAFSIHNIIPTYVMFLRENTMIGSQILTVRSTPGNEEKAKEIVTEELEKIIPNDPFEFKNFSVNFFLDEGIRFWQLMKRIFLFFAVVTLLVSSIGLFGLMLLTIRLRTKEIGVRKVLGSSVGSIYRKLSYEVIRLLGIAILIASPMVLQLYNKMPGAYKEPLSITVFLLGIGIVALVAFLTISFHIYKAALSNPVDALKYE